MVQESWSWDHGKVPILDFFVSIHKTRGSEWSNRAYKRVSRESLWYEVLLSQRPLPTHSKLASLNQRLDELRCLKVCAALKNPTWRPAGHSSLRSEASRDRLNVSRSRRNAALRACNRSCDPTVVTQVVLHWSSGCGVRHGIVEKIPFRESPS